MKPTLVYVASRWPWPVTCGRQRMIAQTLEMASGSHRIVLVALVGNGQRVASIPTHVERAFLLTRPGAISVIVDLLRNPTAPLQSHLFAAGRVPNGLARLLKANPPDVVMLDMIRLAGLAERVRRSHPDARIVLDMDDRLSDRYRQMRENGEGNLLGAFATSMPLPLRWVANILPATILAVERRLTASMEFACADMMDAIAFVSPREAKAYRREVGEMSATTAAVAPSSEPATFRDRDFRHGRRFVFLGNADYAPNREALILLDGIARSVLLSAGPDVTFEAAGSGTDSLPLTNVRGLGFVDDLDAFLGPDAVMVVPIRTGTGIKTKILDAMVRGVPVVATPKGVEGLSIGDADGAIVREVNDLARTVSEICEGRHDDALMQVAARAAEVARSEHDHDVVAMRLLSLLDGRDDPPVRSARTWRQPPGHRHLQAVHAVTMAMADVLAFSLSLVMGLVAAKYLSPALAHVPFAPLTKAFHDRAPIALPIFFVGLLWAYARGHYTDRVPFWSEAKDVVSLAALCVVAEAFIQFSMKEQISRSWIVGSWALFVPTCLGLRSWMKWSLLRVGIRRVSVTVFGDRDGSTTDALHSERLLGFQVVDRVVGMDPDEATGIMRRNGSRFAVVVMGGDADMASIALAGRLSHDGTPFALSPPIGGLGLATMRPVSIFGHDAVLLTERRGLNNPMARGLKRAVDVVGGAIGLVAFAPLVLAFAVAVSVEGGRPFFSQVRVGRNGRPIKVWKVRSMVVDAEVRLETYLGLDEANRERWERDRKLKDDPRITGLGRFMRRAAIDEIPQFWNVLKGDMSLVGPRPVVSGEIADYGASARCYLDVRPGLTGLWQASGRSDTTYARRVALDCWYVRNWSLWIDVVIILKTVPALLGRRGAY